MAATRNSGRRRTLAVVWSTVLALLLGGGTMATQRYLQEEDRAEQTAWVMSPAQSRPSAAPSVRPSKPSPPSSPVPASLEPKRTAPKTTPPPRSATPKHSRSVVAAPRTGQIKDSRGECADNNSSSTEDGNRLQVVPCNDTTAQLWTVRRDSRIEVQGRCMTVAENATAHGSRVVLFRCGTAVAQLWQSRADGTLVNPASDRCLDVLAESDTALVLHDCVGRPSQQWRLPAAT